MRTKEDARAIRLQCMRSLREDAAAIRPPKPPLKTILTDAQKLLSKERNARYFAANKEKVLEQNKARNAEARQSSRDRVAQALAAEVLRERKAQAEQEADE